VDRTCAEREPAPSPDRHRKIPQLRIGGQVAGHQDPPLGIDRDVFHIPVVDEGVLQIASPGADQVAGAATQVVFRGRIKIGLEIPAKGLGRISVVACNFSTQKRVVHQVLPRANVVAGIPALRLGRILACLCERGGCLPLLECQHGAAEPDEHNSDQ
jgi:hypothetical protein